MLIDREKMWCKFHVSCLLSNTSTNCLHFCRSCWLLTVYFQWSASCSLHCVLHTLLTYWTAPLDKEWWSTNWILQAILLRQESDRSLGREINNWTLVLNRISTEDQKDVYQEIIFHQRHLDSIISWQT